MRTEPKNSTISTSSELDPVLETVFREGRFAFDIYWQQVFCKPIVQGGLPDVGNALGYVPYVINFVEHLMRHDDNLGRATYLAGRDIASDALSTYVGNMGLSKLPLPSGAGSALGWGLEVCALAAPHIEKGISLAEVELQRFQQQKNNPDYQLIVHDLQKGIAVHKLVVCLGKWWEGVKGIIPSAIDRVVDAPKLLMQDFVPQLYAADSILNTPLESSVIEPLAPVDIAPPENKDDKEIEAVLPGPTVFSENAPSSVPHSSSNPTVKGLGEIVSDIRIIPQGIHVGVASINNFTEINIGVGVEFSDSIISGALNRMAGGYGLKSGWVTLYGQSYRWRIIAIGGASHLYDMKMTVTKGGSKEHHTEWFTLEAYELSNPENESVIKEALQKGLSPLVKAVYERDRHQFQQNCNQALSQHNYAEAHRFHREFFSKYDSFSSELQANGQQIQTQITDAEKNYRIATVSETELRVLAERPEYVDYLPSIYARLDKLVVGKVFAKNGEQPLTLEAAYKDYESVKDPSARANLLFSLAYAHQRKENTQEELEMIAEGFRQALASDSTHRGAIEHLANCYLRQHKYEEALNLVQTRILTTVPQDLFGLSVKATGEFRQGRIEESRSTFNLILAQDPENQFAYRMMASTYAEEAAQCYKIYLQDRQAQQENTEFLLSICSGKTFAAIQANITTAEKCLAELGTALKEQEAFASHIKPIHKEEGSEEQCPKAFADKEKGEIRKEIERVVDVATEDRKQLKHARSTIAHFWVQSAQMGTDAAFYIADAALSRISQKNNAMRPGAIKIQQSLRRIQAPISNGLQLVAHHYRSKLEAASATGLNYGRYALLSVEVGRALLGALRSELPPQVKSVIQAMNNYVSPIGQLSLSVGFMLSSPVNFVAGALSLESLLNVPKAQQFLLKPNPHDKSGPTRFFIGRTLMRVMQDKSVVSQFEKASRFVATYSSTLSAWVKWALSLGLSEQAAHHLVVSVNTWQAGLISGLQGNLSRIGLATISAKVIETFVSLSGLYLLFKACQFGLALVQTGKNFDREWGQCYFEWLDQQFVAGRHAIQTQTPQASGLFFKQLKEESRDLLHKTDAANEALKKLYILSLYLEHIFSGVSEKGETEKDGNCLFHAVAHYTGLDHSELRRKAVEYERAHQRKFVEKNLILANEFQNHVQEMSQVTTWGTSAEVYALSIVLNRPIIVVFSDGNINIAMDNLSYSLSELTGEPIFLILDEQEKHYRPILLRGEYYFECDYKKYLQAQDAKLKAMPKKSPEACQQANIESKNKAMAALQQLQGSVGGLVTILNKIDAAQCDTLRSLAEIQQKEGVSIVVPPVGLTKKSRVINGVTFFENNGLTDEEESLIFYAADTIKLG